MDDFASTALYNLIAVELKRQGFDARTNMQFAGKTDRREKARLLDAAKAALGPSALLRIGTGISRSPFNASLAVLLSAVDAEDFVNRWQRLETYYHGRHRVRTIESSIAAVTLEHYAISGGGPSESEDLVIAGLLAAMLQRIGAQGLGLFLGEAQVIVDGEIPSSLPDYSKTSVWRYQWTGFESENRQDSAPATDQSVVERVLSLLRSDLGRAWKLATVAKAMALSPRSLQRHLAVSGASFQSLLRSARADGAAAMLLSGRAGLAEVGYATGFSDQAHFSRDFKLRFNMAPSAYLALNQQGETGK